MIQRILIGLTFAACLPVMAAEAQFQPLFNGKDLSGWSGNPALWTVKEGAITGRTTAEDPLKANTFLIYTNPVPGDFELRCQYKIVPLAPQGGANSGIQYRSKVLDPAAWVVGGYQADIEAGNSYTGILYEERMSRGIMALRGEKVLWDKDSKKQVTGSLGDAADIQKAIRKEDWNEYRIVANGNKLEHWINGKQSVEVTDETAEKRQTNGVIAVQLHVGPPMQVQFKDVKIRALK